MEHQKKTFRKLQFSLNQFFLQEKYQRDIFILKIDRNLCFSVGGKIFVSCLRSVNYKSQKFGSESISCFSPTPPFPPFFQLQLRPGEMVILVWFKLQFCHAIRLCSLFKTEVYLFHHAVHTYNSFKFS